MYGGPLSNVIYTGLFISLKAIVARDEDREKMPVSQNNNKKHCSCGPGSRLLFFVHWHQSIYAFIYLSAWKQLLHKDCLTENKAIVVLEEPEAHSPLLVLMTAFERVCWGVLCLGQCQSTSFYFSIFFLSHEIANGKQICSFGISFFLCDFF